MFSMGHIYKQNQVPKCCCFFATENCGTVMYLVFFKTVQDTRDGTWREGTHGLPNQHQSAPLSNKYNEDDSQHWAPLMVPNGTRADRVIGRFCWLSHYPCRIAVFNPPPPPLSHPLNTQPTHPTPPHPLPQSFPSHIAPLPICRLHSLLITRAIVKRL